MDGRAGRLARIAVVGLVVAAGCSDDDDGTDGADPIGLGEAGVGTCLLFADDVGPEVEQLPVVDCAVEHSHEIFAVLDHPDDVYPGFDALEQFAQTECLGAFEPYVGVGAFDSALFYSWLVPTLDGWNDEDDREVVCVLGRHDAALMTGSMRDSNI
jgi:hypothetical protein